MYKQIDKKKERKERKNSQRKGNGKQSFGFVDKRSKTKNQTGFNMALPNNVQQLKIEEGVMDSTSEIFPLTSVKIIQLMKVTMPDKSVVDTDYMNNEALEQAMKIYMDTIHDTHFANPLLKFYEANYNKLSQALFQRTSGDHLLIGEGDFGYSHSLSKKQNTTYNHMPQLLATEFRDRGALEKDYPDTFPQNMEEVEKSGGYVRFGVDAMAMTKSFHKGSHFPIVTSMFPNTGSRNRKTQGPLTHDVVGGLFSGSAKFQEPGDQLVLTVPQKYSHGKRHSTYGMQKHAPEQGYTLMNKFQFDPLLHPPYEHRMTKKNKSAKSMGGVKKG